MINEYYEDLTEDEADFILDLYEVINRLVYNGYPVTLVRLGFELGVGTEELSDHLPVILIILNKVEQEYAEIRQEPD